MNLKLPANEFRRAVKILFEVMGQKQTRFRNIQIRTQPDRVEVRATNGTMFGKITIPTIGAEEETICVDGDMLKSIVQIASGSIEIQTTGNVCTIKTVGQTRIPIVDANLPENPSVTGVSTEIEADDFIRACEHIVYAISTDESRQILTGALIETDGTEMRMVSLDGFRMSIESILANGESMKIVVPSVALKTVRESVFSGEKITIISSEGRVLFRTDSMELTCVLLSGEYVDYRRLIPDGFKFSAKFRTSDLKSALRCGEVVCEKKNLVKLGFTDHRVTISNNSDEAEYEADIDCQTLGGDISIAFNIQYLQSTLAAIDTEYAEMSMNSPTSPAILKPEGSENIRLILPVRVFS